MLLPHNLGLAAIKEYEFPPHLQQLEREILKLIYLDDFNRLSISIPVNCGKTYALILTAAWYLLLHPDKEIILCSNTADFAALTAYRIKSILEQFGWNFHKSYSGKESFRSKEGGALYSCGVMGSVAGRRADVLLMDDLNKSQDSVLSPVVMKRMYVFVYSELLTRLRDGSSKVVLIGSRRSESDIIGQIIVDNEALPQAMRWKIINRPAVENDQSIWPSRFPLSYFHDIRETLESKGLSHIWSSLYQNDPRGDPETTAWDDKYLTPEIFYDELPPNQDWRAKIVAFDPALGVRTANCDQAALYLLFGRNGHIWVDDGTLAVIPIDQAEDAVVHLNQTHSPDSTVVETNGQFILTAENIARKLSVKGLRNTVHVRESRGDKISRIKLVLTPLLRSKQLHIRKSIMGRRLYQQMREFPSGLRCDGPDAIAIGVQHIMDVMSAPPRKVIRV